MDNKNQYFCKVLLIRENLLKNCVSIIQSFDNLQCNSALIRSLKFAELGLKQMNESIEKNNINPGRIAAVTVKRRFTELPIKRYIKLKLMCHKF